MKPLKSQYLLLLCCISLFFINLPTVEAQNCSQINSWLGHVERYADGIDLNTMDAYGILRLSARAYHNDHFKPVFGKNYAELSETEKATIKSKLLNCAQNKRYVSKGLVTSFEPGNIATAWNRQIKAVNSSPIAEVERMFQYEQQNRATNRAKQARANQQRTRYNQQRTAARTRSRTRTPAPQNPNGYNASPKERVNTTTNYKTEAVAMKPFLTAIKNNQAPAHNFSMYKNSALMARIYAGEFEGFPIGLRDMQEQNVMGGLSKLNHIKKYERYLLLYLEYFSTHCGSKRPSDYKKVSITYEVIKTKNNVSSSEGLTAPEIYYLKPYFEEDFRRMHKNLSNAAPIEAVWIIASGEESGLNFEPDLKLLFGQEKCESPMVRQFETNLYLAAKGKSLLQKLLPYHN